MSAKEDLLKKMAEMIEDPSTHKRLAMAYKLWSDKLRRLAKEGKAGK